MSGLRERNKAMRVDAILDAAVELLDDTGLDVVTTEAIAAKAGVAAATVYNLIGTRDDLLRSLVRRVVTDLVDAVAQATASDDNPIAVAHLIVDHSVAAFTSHSDAYRQVVAAGRSVDGQVGAEWVDPSQLQVAALRQAQALGVLRDDVDPEPLGRQIYISWIGAMDQWAHGLLDDQGFAVATRHGLLSVLAAAAAEPHRSEFIAQLTDVGRDLAPRWRF
ncbi:MAG: TetR/AcrR family transcriptional regulator [Ilumatobacteraceae bacterium]|nr:TetR/AcrR family transcriptional regulator [Ilumatobacteraceae bacterium]